jgi:hypothetical protein
VCQRPGRQDTHEEPTAQVALLELTPPPDLIPHRLCTAYHDTEIGVSP